MSAALAIKSEAARRGIRLWIDGGRLIAEGPLSDQFIERLRANKSELMALLRPRMAVYQYRLVDTPTTWLFYLAPGLDLAGAEHALRARYEARLLEVRPHDAP
ncbi:MAG: hypothetical protein M0Z84_03970 [Gammaproteobacteria bacterium]|nr:hypothetical protein [Gammaproteobacteria bacterium]